MFLFLKTKKGFTLVELMIVVVIMAILVAVAVPVYSAVTKNSAKTACADNRRIVISQVSNFCNGSTNGGQHFTTVGTVEKIVFTSDGEKGTFKSSDSTTFTEAVVKSMFQKYPYCPSAKPDATVDYTITVTGNGADKTPNITVDCDFSGHN